VSVIFIVVPLATLVVLVAVIAFVVSAKRGQFDDLDTPAVRMLHDEPATPNATTSSSPSRRAARRPSP
jgi:cbb3-type cytochrome oxidase maturation protein